MDLAYGPVASRRLGQSLGINNIPPKTCSYACIYCQLGPTTASVPDRTEFYEPEEIVRAVETRVSSARNVDESIDYLSFVPDGEPTLDVNLGRSIDRLTSFDIDIAVISNASLVDREDVRTDLAKADYVSLKVDAGAPATWKRIDRPHAALSFEEMTRGMQRFSEEFEGTLTTETMLVDGVNDDEPELERTAELVRAIDPDTAYVAVPTRPPAEDWVKPASETAIGNAYRLFDERLESVEYLIGAEPDTFAWTGDVREDILGMTAVHPMREHSLRELLDRAGEDWSVVETLLNEGDLIERSYEGESFYMRPIQTMSE